MLFYSFLHGLKAALDATAPEAGNGQFLVWPNPSSGKTFVDIGNTERGEKVRFALYDLQGKRVMTGEAQSGLFELDMYSLPKGTYLLEVRAGERVNRGKVMKEWSVALLCNFERVCQPNQIPAGS